MPIYEFQCQACGARIDQLMRLSDPDPVDCPECGKPALSRQLSAPQFRLAGGGWYETDFKGDKDKKRNLAGDGAAKGDTAKPAETTGAAPPKADSAPAKTESKPAPAKSGGDTDS